MGYSLFSNSHFKMGVTIMGFAEHFGLGLSKVVDSAGRIYLDFIPCAQIDL